MVSAGSIALPASGKSTIAVIPCATSELMSEMAFCVLPSPLVYRYFVTLGHCAEIVTHLQPAGPFAGWAQIDEDRTDCLVLRLKETPNGELEPARLYAQVTFWRAADKVRKRPMFSIWASQTLKWADAQLPRTATKFIHIGPDARARAKAGELKLTYLYRPITDQS